MKNIKDSLLNTFAAIGMTTIFVLACSAAVDDSTENTEISQANNYGKYQLLGASSLMALLNTENGKFVFDYAPESPNLTVISDFADFESKLGTETSEAKNYGKYQIAYATGRIYLSNTENGKFIYIRPRAEVDVYDLASYLD